MIENQFIVKNFFTDHGKIVKFFHILDQIYLILNKFLILTIGNLFD